VKEEVKQQILAAVDNIYLQNMEDDVFGYADVTIQNILAHINTNNGTLEPSDLETNRNKLAEQWNPDNPFEFFWIRVKRIRAVATAGADPIQDGATIEFSLTAFRKGGVYDHVITTWEDKTPTEQTSGKTFKRISTIMKKRISSALLHKLQDIMVPITAKRSLPTKTRQHQNLLLQPNIPQHPQHPQHPQQGAQPNQTLNVTTSNYITVGPTDCPRTPSTLVPVA
jgi:hypothetical protein